MIAADRKYSNIQSLELSVRWVSFLVSVSKRKGVLDASVVASKKSAKGLNATK